jgi:spermidine/putrescine-binding protein
VIVHTGQLPTEIEACFESVHGVQIERREYSSSDDLKNILEQGTVEFDILQVPDHMVAGLIRAGVLQRIDRARLAAFENIDPSYLNLSFDPGNEYTVPFQSGTYGLVVNTTRVPGMPVAWADLWKPEYDGRMVFLQESRAVIGAVLLSLGYDVNSQSPLELERARVKLLELVPKIRVFDSDNPRTALIAGDLELGMTWTAPAQAANAADPAIQFLYPSEGAILWQDNWAISGGSCHIDAAYAWLNYTLQADVAWMFLQDAPFTTPNRAALEYMRAEQVESYDLYIKSPITNTSLAALAAGHRLADVGPAAGLYQRIWREATGFD